MPGFTKRAAGKRAEVAVGRDPSTRRGSERVEAPVSGDRKASNFASSVDGMGLAVRTARESAQVTVGCNPPARGRANSVVHVAVRIANDLSRGVDRDCRR